MIICCQSCSWNILWESGFGVCDNIDFDHSLRSLHVFFRSTTWIIWIKQIRKSTCEAWDDPIKKSNWLARKVGNEGPSTFTGWYIGDETSLIPYGEGQLDNKQQQKLDASEVLNGYFGFTSWMVKDTRSITNKQIVKFTSPSDTGNTQACLSGFVLVSAMKFGGSKIFTHFIVNLRLCPFIRRWQLHISLNNFHFQSLNWCPHLATSGQDFSMPSGMARGREQC